jgi:hypothetical protein
VQLTVGQIPAYVTAASQAMNPKFPLGQLVATPGALAAAHESGDNLACFIRRHVQGDWGELCADDVRENVFSIQNGLRLLSAYRLKDGTKIWIITEADRSVTTVLLPEEY